MTCGEWENEDRGSICDRSLRVSWLPSSVFANECVCEDDELSHDGCYGDLCKFAAADKGVAAHAQSQGSNVEAERGRLSCGRVARRPGRAPQGRGPRPFSPHAPCRSPGALTRVAVRTLARSTICDRLHRRLQPFRYLHDCSGCFRLERLAGGACTHWKAPPCHGAHVKRTSRSEADLAHSSASPALRNPSARAGGIAKRSVSILTVSLGLARSASARTDFASSILPWSA